MKYNWGQKLKYFIGGLFIEQDWRTSVDEKNRRKVGLIIVYIITLMYVFIFNNIFQSYLQELTNLTDIYLWFLAGSIYTFVFIPYGIRIKRIYKNIRNILTHMIFAFTFNFGLAIRWEKRK